MKSLWKSNFVSNKDQKKQTKQKLKLLHVDILLLKDPVLSWMETLALRD